MALKPFELTYFYKGADDIRVFERILQFRDKATQEPIAYDAIAARMNVTFNNPTTGFGRRIVALTLGDGLTWSETDKSLHILITNNQLRGITEDGDAEVSFWVEWESKAPTIIMEGTVTAVRVD